MPKNEPNYELRVIDEKVRGFSFIIFQTVDFSKNAFDWLPTVVHSRSNVPTFLYF